MNVYIQSTSLTIKVERIYSNVFIHRKEITVMNSKTMLFISMTCLVLLVSSSSGAGVFTKSDDDFEVSQQTAANFLSMNDDSTPINHNKREMGKNCVPCKFGVNPCCAPNICVKKTLRPDECMEIKSANKP